MILSIYRIKYNMPAAKYDFSVEQGTSFSLIIVYKNANGDVVDLTNWCGRIIVKTNSNETLLFNTGHSGSDYQFSLDEPNGKFTLLWPAVTTNSFTFNTAKYDLELQRPDDFYVDGGNYIERALYGSISVIKRFSQNSTILECQP